MQVLLGVTLLFAVVWFVALRPKPATTADTAAAPVAPAQEAPAAPAPAPAAEPEPAARAPKAVAAAKPGDSAQVRLVRTALRQRKAIAIAFVTPTVADARAVAEEMRHVSTFAGKAVTIEAPLSELSRYGFITREVEVTVAPTVVIVAPNRNATTIVGFADRFEIEQRLADALGQRRS